MTLEDDLRHLTDTFREDQGLPQPTSCQPIVLMMWGMYQGFQQQGATQHEAITLTLGWIGEMMKMTTRQQQPEGGQWH